MINKNHLTKYLLLIGLVITLPIAADNASKLKAIDSKITHLKSDITKQKQQKQSETNNLKKIEIEIGSLAKKIRNTQRQQQKQQKELESLSQKQLILKGKLAQQQTALSTEIRTAYMLGDANSLKMLLNQENPEQLSRNLTYYHYFAKERVHIIDQVKQTMNDLKTTEQEIEQQNKILNNTKQKLTTEKHKQENNKQTRLTVIKTLNHELSSKQGQLTSLVKNKQALEELIASIEHKNKLAQQKKSTPSTQPFNPSTDLATLRGKLSWPTQGKIVQGFGQRVGGSELQTTGVVIRAPTGEKVYAVAQGKVVFARWMQGYGLLVIIDHGNGYMSIYGRNNSLFVANGDIVKKQQVIAEVGESGGYAKPGLYFSIRHGAAALNPSRWCSQSGRHRA